jgi:hypothetical protein
MATISTINDRIPRIIPGVTPLNGNRNPVRLVATVVTKNAEVKMLRRRDESSPKMTNIPAPMPHMLRNTWRNVNCAKLKPRIMELSFQGVNKRFLLRSTSAISGKRRSRPGELLQDHPAAALSRASPSASKFRRNFQSGQINTRESGLNNNSREGDTL